MRHSLKLRCLGGGALYRSQLVDITSHVSTKGNMTLEQDRGFEPPRPPWKGGMLPLHQSCIEKIVGVLLRQRLRGHTWHLRRNRGLTYFSRIKLQSFLALQPYHITHYSPPSSITEIRPSNMFQCPQNCTVLMPLPFSFP